MDRLIWTIQAKVGDRSPSGEIVFVEVPDDALESDADREDIKSALMKLNRHGADQVFLDLAQPDLSDEISTQQLRETVEAADNVFVVGRLFNDRSKTRLIFPPIDLVGSSNRVIADHRPDFLGFVWRVRAQFEVEGSRYQSFGAALSKRDVADQSEIEIDYRLDSGSLPSVPLEQVVSGELSPAGIYGKSFVFGYGGAGTGSAANLPGSGAAGAAPQTYIAIYAAETVRAGGMYRLGADLFDYIPFLLTCVLLVSIGILASDRSRKIAYAGVGVALVTVLAIPVFVPIRTGASGGLVFLSVYVVLSLFHRWRSHINLESAETGLPTLQRLERDLEAIGSSDLKALIAVKIHNFSDVMAMLPADQKVEYFHGIVKRLRIGDTGLVVYSNSSDRLLWLQDFENADTLKSHLVALLAIFKSPLRIGVRPVDVSITFGVDMNFTGEAHKRISAAEALTDKTSLSAQPIIIGDQSAQADDEWRISLQAKIDAALEAGEIFPVFQPQVDIATGEVVGFEGLVRWNDSERGFISPSYFVEQCEHAGRMEKLQQFMLRECIEKFRASPAMSTNAWLSVNVSATLLSDTWLTELVADTVESTGFPASRLVLEITETARIHDHHTATAVLRTLADLGLHLSLDDFGTGLAGFETFFRLPFSEIKVDRLFTEALTRDEKARAIVNNALCLGRELDVRVIVEGVEDSETLEVLTGMGCRYAQGYLFGKPHFDLNAFNSKETQWLTSP